MQGGEQGERPHTAVQTQAEKDKFDREAYMYLTSPETRQRLGGQAPAPTIDFNVWAEQWNEDVAQTERDVKAGRLEPSEDPANQINRKQPFDLSNWWTESRKDVNTARTAEKNKVALEAMYRRNRVRLHEPSTNSSAATGATQDGSLFSFPLVNDGSETRPRPAPSLAFVDEAPCEQGDADDDCSIIDVGEVGTGIGLGALGRGVCGAAGEGASGAAGGGASGAAGGAAGGGASAGASGAVSGAAGEAAGGGASGGISGGVSGAVSGAASVAAGGAASGGASANQGPGRVRQGDGAFVVPAAACSVLQSVAPTFGRGIGFASSAQVWNPQPPVPPPAPAPTASSSRARSCQVCGHNPAKPKWKPLHKGGNRWSRRVCLVPAGDDQRKPDRAGSERNRFKDLCDCKDCL